MSSSKGFRMRLYRVLHSLSAKGYLNFLSDEKYLRMMYRIKFNKPLNLKNPKTYSEKLQWIKLHDRKPIYTTMVDKALAKDYVAERIGKDHIIPTLGIWDRVEDIDFDSLPNQFVLKCTHDSGGLCICTDKKTFDFDKARAKLNRSLKKNYYLGGREWPYKDVKRRIIAEKYMIDSKTGELRDYKFFSFNGEPKLLFIAADRQTQGMETTFDFFDMDFNLLDFTNGHPHSEKVLEKPLCFEQMKAFTKILSKGIPQLRVDFYEVDGKVYFGEMTFFHWSGLMPFNPESWDRVLGDWIHLPID